MHSIYGELWGTVFILLLTSFPLLFGPNQSLVWLLKLSEAFSVQKPFVSSLFLQLHKKKQMVTYFYSI